MKNKTDKELQELAARAVGLDSSAVFQNGGDWDPLSDSEQAFDLMVELKFRVDHIYAYKQQVMVGDGEYWAIAPYNGNPYAATRRAIVIAAAKLAEGRYGH